MVSKTKNAGEIIASDTTPFVPDSSNGTATVTISFDTKGHDYNDEFVVYEYILDSNDTELAKHENISDPSQTLRIEEERVSATVNNDGNGTASASPTSGTTGTEVTLTATPNSGYQFKEWQVVSGGASITGNKFNIGTANVEVKAIFELIPTGTYTITFNANGGKVNGSDTDTATTGTDGKLTSLPTPTRSGSYSFDGWYTAAIGGKKAALSKVYTANTAIYAHWTHTGGGYTTQYTTSYNTNGGSTIAATKHNSGTAAGRNPCRRSFSGKRTEWKTCCAFNAFCKKALR